MMNKAVFLDKDGTIVDNSQYPYIIPTDKILHSQVIQGLKTIQDKGYKLIIVSNQSWIAKNRLTREETEKIFSNIVQELKKHDIEVLDYFYCPHQKNDNCECRKPKTKMFSDAAIKHNISINDSIMIGDADTDIKAGKSLGMKTILVLTGEGKKFEKTANPDFIIEDLNKIGDVI